MYLRPNVSREVGALAARLELDEVVLTAAASEDHAELRVGNGELQAECWARRHDSALDRRGGVGLVAHCAVCASLVASGRAPRAFGFRFEVPGEWIVRTVHFEALQNAQVAETKPVIRLKQCCYSVTTTPHETQLTSDQ